MTETLTDEEYINNTRNLARYFTESRVVAWVLLVFVLLWGLYSYQAMNKRKNPEYSNLYCGVACSWPGASAEKVEQLVTRKLEEKISENMKVVDINSLSRNGIAVITVKLDDRVGNTEPEFTDIKARLDSIYDLPNGAGPILFDKNYDDITTLMLTVASPKVNGVELSIRAESVARAIIAVRRAPNGPHHCAANDERVSIVGCFPYSVSPVIPRRARDIFVNHAVRSGILKDVRLMDGSGFVGIDAQSLLHDAELQAYIQRFARQRLKISHLHPDLWDPAVIHAPAQTKQALEAVAGDKYSYRDLETFTDLIKRSLQTLREVTKITRHGILDEQINLDYSQQRLAASGIQPGELRQRLAAHNISSTGGLLEVGGKTLPIVPSGELNSEQQIGSIVAGMTDSGTPIYFRDVLDINRDYQSPPRFLNFFNWRGHDGRWQRSRAVTLAIYMRKEEHIDQFAVAVDKVLKSLRERLPDDLIIERASDQPKQVEDSIELFMMSLYEAIALVVLTTLIGFWEWRSALLIALSIPITLAMTFGAMFVLGIDIQQCSVAALIIALGLLVDDPVVAGDAIKRARADGQPPIVASWLGPTKLAHAIMFATLTNIAAYLPLLMISGEIGQFIFSLPIVITISLVVSRMVSMTFVPLLSYYLLRPRQKSPDNTSGGWKQRVISSYMDIGGLVLEKRVLVLAISVVLLIGGFVGLDKIKSSFFPNDLFNLCWVDVRLPEDSTLTATNDAAVHVEKVARDVLDRYSADQEKKVGKHRDVLNSIVTFLGGSGPRFWSSVLPEVEQLNYAQVLIKLDDKHDTDQVVPLLQQALSSQVSEGQCDVRMLEGGKPVGLPVAIRISGSDASTLRRLAASMANIMRECPIAERVRDDWGSGCFTVHLRVNSDRANLAGLTNQDVADSSLAGLSGFRIDTLRQKDKEIPIMVRMRAEESSQIQNLNDLYVYSGATQERIPLPEVASIQYSIEQAKIRRRNQFRTITVGCYPVSGYLPSEVMEKLRTQLNAFTQSLPPGYLMTIGGEEEEQQKSFGELVVVMTVSVISIFLCLVIQFKNIIKPIIVFAAIPYGMLGALVGLSIMGSPFGFPAFMGVASLTGVIVSHVIVLFDFIELNNELGLPIKDALLRSAMMRLRPVLITVGATVLGFIPLAMHGGPLWEPLCYAQIGGLVFATVATLLLVPLMYAVATLDLKLIQWGEPPTRHGTNLIPQQAE